MKYIAWYTEGTVYEEIFKSHLEPTLKEYGLDYEGIPMPNYGSWHSNVAQKPYAILHALKKYEEPIVVIDVDAKITAEPSLFERIKKDEFDIAYHSLDWESWYNRPNRTHKKEILTGTMWFNYNETVLEFLEQWSADTWRSRCADQTTIEMLMKGEWKKLRVCKLPLEYCYSEDTEVLTDQGWKYFYDLDKTEKVVTLNTTKNIVEYKKPIDYYEGSYIGDMYKVKTSRLNLLVTPDHNIYVKNKRLNGEFRGKIKDYPLNSSAYFYKGFPYENHKKDNKTLQLPELIYKKQQYDINTKTTKEINIVKTKKEITTKEFLKFLGWYLTEGWLSNQKGNNYKITI